MTLRPTTPATGRSMSRPARRAVLGMGLAAGVAVVLDACASGTALPGRAPAAAGGGSAGRQDVSISHVHAVSRDPADGSALFATHEGLFRFDRGALTELGQGMDLMGFTIAPDGTYYASGHPGPGTDLPQPLGLARSVDRGRSWTVVSRGGQSDFHALAAGPATIIGFDGTLRVSADGRTWREARIFSPPAALAASPRTGRILATTERGLLLSTDQAGTWRPLRPPSAPLFVAWADDDTIVGSTAAGELVQSPDAGATWTTGRRPLGQAHALGASRTREGRVEVLLVTADAAMLTLDLGATTTTLG
ncbi:MAG TPA: hypothetical protein VFJ97_02555 [Dermatophilaceae bacterium]|nr:hypothetical protein [Dermatophilaceae bacterium]